MGEPASELDAVRRSLAATAPEVVVEWVDETGSTNTDLAERARQATGPLVPTLRVAGSQTAGRGRHGRRWHAAPGTALTFSLARTLAPVDPSGLSLAVGTALAEAIDPRPAGAPPRVGLKWPNDLWLLDAARASRFGGRKLGGILIEVVPTRSGGRAAIVGVGINVAPATVADAASGFACLHEIEPAATPLALLARLAPPLAAALAAFDRDGWGAWRERFADRDVLRGRAVRAGDVAGVAAGVSAAGELLVRGERGLVAVTSGEVRIEPIAEASC